MLLAIREKVTGVVALVFIVGIAIFMVVPMLYQYVAGMGDNSALSVDGEDVSIQAFNQRLSQNRQNLMQAFGGELPEGMGDDILVKRTSDQLIQQLLQDQATMGDGFRVSDEQLVDMLSGIPEFQVDGRFDNETYEKQLRSIGMSPARFEQRLVRDFVHGQFQRGITDTAFVAPGELERYVALLYQSRDIEYIVFSGEDFRQNIELSDEEVTRYFDEHQQQFMHPEKVKVEYVTIDFESYKDGVEVTDKEVRSEYQAGVDSGRYASKEQREASHILFAFDSDADESAREQSRQKAEEVLSEIRQGADFAEMARQHSDDPGSAEQGGSLGKISEGVMVPEFEQAVFSLEEEGAVSGLVESPFGYHLIQLDRLAPATPQPFEEVEQDIRSELAANKARTNYQSDLDEMSNLAFENADSLTPVAEAVSRPVESSDWFTRDQGEGVAGNSIVREAAFRGEILNDRYNSGTLDLESGKVAVLRVAAHEPRQPKSLDESRGEVVAELKRSKLETLLEQAQEEARSALQDGESPRAIAERLDGVLESVDELTRKNDQRLPQALVQTVFKMPLPAGDEATVALSHMSGEDLAVVRLLGSDPGRLETVSESERQELTDQLRNNYGGLDYAAVLNVLREEASIDINRSLIQENTNP
ncbi:MAG: SurA N-terminal domain-containing protein [Pseudomonadota bacterium]